jgi:hypothetical protein
MVGEESVVKDTRAVEGDQKLWRRQVWRRQELIVEKTRVNCGEDKS